MRNSDYQNIRKAKDFSIFAGILFFLGFIIPLTCAIAIIYVKGITHIEALPANEIGDFLAGIFGPGALLILAASFLLQKRELVLQREELTETRLTLKEQGEQLAFSAKEAERQNKILEIQSIIAKWEIRKSSLFGIALIFQMNFNRAAGIGLDYSNIEEFYRKLISQIKDLPGMNIILLHSYLFPSANDGTMFLEDKRKRAFIMMREARNFIDGMQSFLNEISNYGNEKSIL